MSYTPKAQLGRGSTIGWATTAGSGSTAAFLSLVSITPPSPSVGEAENVIIASLFKGYLPTIPEGEGSFKVQHWDGDPGCLAMMNACAVAPVPVGTFTITFPSGATITFPGFPKKYAIDETSNEEIITAEVDFRMTGTWTLTPPTGP